MAAPTHCQICSVLEPRWEVPGARLCDDCTRRVAGWVGARADRLALWAAPAEDRTPVHEVLSASPAVLAEFERTIKAASGWYQAITDPVRRQIIRAESHAFGGEHRQAVLAAAQAIAMMPRDVSRDLPKMLAILFDPKHGWSGDFAALRPLLLN